MPFVSIVFQDGGPELHAAAPAFFKDLNLGDVVEAACKGSEEYNLKPLFYSPLSTVEDVVYRQQVMKDISSGMLARHLENFSEGIKAMRAHLAQGERLAYDRQKQHELLLAAECYHMAVVDLAANLAADAPQSTGLCSFGQWLADYTAGERFTRLGAETQHTKQALADVRYTVHIKDRTVQVEDYTGQADYGKELENFFLKFRQGDVRDYLCDLPTPARMNHVEAAILTLVAKRCPEPFAMLSAFADNWKTFADPVLIRFDREIQFYLAFLRFTDRFTERGLSFCLPEVTATRGVCRCADSFDLALAAKNLGTEDKVVCNGVQLNEGERIMVVTGPNQGGKTTFARMMGQLFYLARLGCPVPGTQASLSLVDGLFTHFERDEQQTADNGRLQDDLHRAHRMLTEATSSSLFIFNEIFSSTTVQDALFLGREVMGRVSRLDALCVWVTFLDELASFDEKTVSLTSLIDPEDKQQRTFRIVRRAADGKAYAVSIARRHGLSYSQIKERIK